MKQNVSERGREPPPLNLSRFYGVPKCNTVRDIQMVKRKRNKRGGPHFTEEAKAKALALLERGDVTRHQLAEELGVSPVTLWRWEKRQAEAEGATPLSSGERKRLKTLARENERLKLELEILKKARTFSTKHHS